MCSVWFGVYGLRERLQRDSRRPRESRPRGRRDEPLHIAAAHRIAPATKLGVEPGEGHPLGRRKRKFVGGRVRVLQVVGPTACQLGRYGYERHRPLVVPLLGGRGERPEQAQQVGPDVGRRLAQVRLSQPATLRRRT